MSTRLHSLSRDVTHILLPPTFSLDYQFVHDHRQQTAFTLILKYATTEGVHYALDWDGCELEGYKLKVRYLPQSILMTFLRVCNTGRLYRHG